MKTKRLAIIPALLLCCVTTLVKAAPPTDASIDELLIASHSEKIVDTIMAQMNANMSNSFKQMSGGKEATPEQKEMQGKMQAAVVGILKEELDWNKLKDLYVKIYRENFTQEEVDGIIAFYKTPAGQALITKMPVIMQKSMSSMQERMMPMTKKIQDKMQGIAKEYQPK